jgi:hypothetical protein
MCPYSYHAMFQILGLYYEGFRECKQIVILILWKSTHYNLKEDSHEY